MAPTATSMAATPSTYTERRLEDDLDLLEHKHPDAKHTLPVLKVTLPADAEDSEEGSPWKLDRRDSGSLFWRRDSVACKTSRIKFRLDVDVREYQPRPEERLPPPPQDDEEDEDIYSDDYILRHDLEPRSWLRPSLRSVFGARRLRLRGGRRPAASGDPPKESSVFMSLVCVIAILVTAWLQGSIASINL